MTGFLSSFQNLAKNEEKLTSHSKSIYGSISEAGELGLWIYQIYHLK